jgi:hypothetical protein
MYGTSYQRQLLDAIGVFLPNGFFLIGPSAAGPGGRRNG